MTDTPVVFYVWPHAKPPGTRILQRQHHEWPRDRMEATRLLDTMYDLVRHLFAVTLKDTPGNAVFQVCPDGGRTHSVQIAFQRSMPYEDVVRDLNRNWVEHRSALADHLLL